MDLQGSVCDPFEIRIALIFSPSLQKPKYGLEGKRHAYDRKAEDVSKKKCKKFE